MAGLAWILIVGGIICALILAPRWGVRVRWQDWRALRRRRQLEDALKHFLSLSQRGQSGSAESLAGSMELSQATSIELLQSMETRGLIRSTGGMIELTAEGERWALQVVRAHRLWERYLADEAGVPMAELHDAAERAEHMLTADHLDQLEAQLGHPARDPHGDPIPLRDGTLASLGAVSLTDWTTDTKAYIVHVEDEPDVVFRQIVALNLKPGDSIRVLERTPEHITIAHGGGEHRLAPVVAANVHVRAAAVAPAMPADAVPLSKLPDESEAEVVALDPSFRGFARRRLLDLGLTPSARVRVELANAFGDPRAYRVRGTLIALREDQARLVWVRLLNRRKEHAA